MTLGARAREKLTMRWAGVHRLLFGFLFRKGEGSGLEGVGRL